MKKLPIVAILTAILLGVGTTKVSASVKAKNKTSIETSVNHASNETPLVFSHRGSPYNEPEHSFAGYNQAIKDGSQYIEQDVWLSKDGKLYVSHDDNLKRTTNKNIKISTSNSNKLAKVKLANGEKLHQLGDVFKKYNKNVHYIIEAKKGAGDNTDTEKALAKVLNQYKMNNNIIMQDSSIPGIKEFHGKKSQKKIPILWLLDSVTERQYTEEIDNAPRYITFISINQDQWTKKLIKKAHHNGFKTNAWTIDTYNDNYNALKIYKFDSLFTNNTKETNKLINKWE
ncbi:glycerophosphodiester phosphodiesterase [Companilactobacillus allii]|uniref:Hydrolase n=1 Tax=Companilactobacillus allii TaxID=1847728 RepID=A0A1P8Q3I0_9LACO|nr:glycerophosphodiester phosphodiesterase [Companilactobacillus allii]APX72398.1 hydrolase [Companilactobacillus allii]USQ69490.1 glycerophosphodiester phosphodiesterase [Companilactobacillus allii]